MLHGQVDGHIERQTPPAALLLKLLQALGFGSLDISDPHWLHKYMTGCGGDLNLHHYGTWAAACQYMFSHWIDIGQASIVRKHFPNAGLSD